MADYSEFVIVTQNELKFGTSACIHNSFWKAGSADKTKSVPKSVPNPHYPKQQLASKSSPYNLVKYSVASVQCKYLVSNSSSFPAEVLFIESGREKDIRKQVKEEFSLGRSVECDQVCGSVVVRILDDKEKFVEEFEKRSANDITFVIKDEKCKGDRHYLAAVSPVFKNMFFGSFIESKQDEFGMEEVESAEVFMDFLMAISPLRVQPNPTNVVELLKLAHRFDIPFLIRDCENNLKHCYELDLSQRIELAGKYDLKGLKLHILESWDDSDWDQMLEDNSDDIRNLGADVLTSGMFTKNDSGENDDE
ncbi:BTB/POZ domain-containing protein [Ditylenchus destructor]|nr:BTB/POZ domain-containing protein [Ditylenchus destructor]